MYVVERGEHLRCPGRGEAVSPSPAAFWNILSIWDCTAVRASSKDFSRLSFRNSATSRSFLKENGKRSSVQSGSEMETWWGCRTSPPCPSQSGSFRSGPGTASPGPQLSSSPRASEPGERRVILVAGLQTNKTADNTIKYVEALVQVSPALS